MTNPNAFEDMPEIKNTKNSDNKIDEAQISSNHPSKSKSEIRRHRKKIKKSSHNKKNK